MIRLSDLKTGVSVVLTLMCGASLFIAACASSHESTNTDVPPDLCPASAFQAADPFKETHGPFSEDCIRRHYGSLPVIPDLTPRYLRTEFVVNSREAAVIGVVYHPTTDSDPVLRIDINVATDANSAGFRSVRTSKGQLLFISAVPSTVTGSVSLNGVVYDMVAIGADPGVADELFLWVANTIESR